MKAGCVIPGERPASKPPGTTSSIPTKNPLLRAVLLICLVAVIHPGSALANTINVNTTADGFDIANCTLRRAIENHNARSQPNKQCGAGSSSDTILVPAVMDLGDPLPGISGAVEIIHNARNCAEMRQAAYMTINSDGRVTLTGVGISSNGSHNISLIDNNGGMLTIRAFNQPCRYTNHKKIPRMSAAL